MSISVKHANQYCCEDITKIKNYDLAMADTEKCWDIHHVLEITRNLTRDQLKQQKLYYHRPASELEFLPHSEHLKLHKQHTSDETRQKMRLKKLGKKYSEEHREKMRLAKLGVPKSEEHKKHMSEAHRGKKFTEEHKRNMRLSWQRRRAKNGGEIKISDEMKLKISQANSGKKHSEATREIMSLKRKKWWENKKRELVNEFLGQRELFEIV